MSPRDERIEAERLDRYFAGECSPTESREIAEFLAGHPGHMDVIARLGQTSPADLDGGWARVRALAARERKLAKPVRWPALAAAAAIVMVVGAALLARNGVSSWIGQGASVHAARQEYVTARAQQLSLRLSDGTRIVLAPASTLRVQGDRSVELVGRAAFTVTHDARRPFTVRAGNLVARDLGTEFVVQAYPDGGHARVVVREGRVAIGDAVVDPGHVGRIAADGQAVVEAADTTVAFAWTAGRLVFERTPLQDVAAEFSRWYDIELRVASPELLSENVTASFAAVEPVSQVLASIARVLSCDVVQTGPRTYTLRISH